MTIADLADFLDLQLEVVRYPNQQGRWSAHLFGVEVKEDSMLVSSYGNGKTPQEAIADYVMKLRGKRIVLNAMRENRTEFTVPPSLLSS